MAKDTLVDLDESLVATLKTITDTYDREDRNERDERKLLWVKLENYFNGLFNIYYDAVARDWRQIKDDKNEPNRHYDKAINNYRANAESIIAALSIKAPSAIFYPDDAEIEEDITTAKTCTKLKKDIERSNNAQLLIIKILMILFNQGMVAAYIYNDKNSKYGTYIKPKMGEDKKIHTIQSNCPECGSNIKEDIFENEKGKVPEEVMNCPVCDYQGTPVQEEFEETVPSIIGSIVEPKSKTCIDIYSPLFVWVPFYSRDQKNIPYLRLRQEQHYSILKNLYPKLKKEGFNPSVDPIDSQDRNIIVGLNSHNLCTVDCWWIRNWALDVIDDKDTDVKELKKRYPNGCYLTYIDGKLVDIHNENLDDHWILSTNPLSSYLHADPLGKPLAPIQEIQNEVIDLQIETFEHSIPETHARADVVDFKKYAQEQSRPGMMYPVNAPQDGTPLSASFHTIKTATLSEEHDMFLRRLDEKAQFVSAAFPSIYGGPSVSGSRTAREYTESRSMALQRLSLTWNVLKFTWADIMSVAVKQRIHYLRSMGQDEKIVEKTETGFINNWIRQTDLMGNIGRVEADVDEEMPMSPAQLKGMLMELMTLKDENIGAAIYHPQNTPLLKKALGAPDFYIPDSDDRDKQYAEFVDLLAGIPVEVNQSVDNHSVEAETCRTFLVSPTGLIIKKTNPEGWSLIEQHMQEHLTNVNPVAPMDTSENNPPQPSPGPVNPEGAINNVG